VIDRSRQPVWVVRRFETFLVAVEGQCRSIRGLESRNNSGLGRRCQWLFKLLWRVADNPFVHKSTIIVGLTLALSAGTLAGIGDWAASGFGDSSADPASSNASAAGPGEYAEGSLVATSPMPASFLPTGSYSPASSPGYTISRTVPEVRLQFTVADEQGRLVSNLSSADIRVLDNQTSVEHFNDFARDDNLPLWLGIVLDTSDSVKRVLPDEKAAALNFLNRIMRPQSDRAFVMAFGADSHIWQTSTADRAQLIDAVGRLHQPGWGTRFYDALYAACDEYRPRTDGSDLVHRAIVVLSDGDDTDSFHTLLDVVAMAQRREIQIYALTLHGKKQAPRGDAILQRLAEQTGGRSYVAQSSKDLDWVFEEIEQDLRTQYYVSFPPAQVTPGFHALRVEVRTPQKLQVHARQGYYALEE
jgi:Ca-activated chloride channel homolog